MAVPSFDELLTQARNVSEEEAGARTGENIAKSLSEFVNKLLLTSPEPRQRFEGFLTKEGEFKKQPFVTGQTVAERGFRRLFGTQFKTPDEGVSLTAKEARTFGIESALEKQKQISREVVANIKKTAQIEAAKIRAKSSRLGSASQKLIGKDLSNTIYNEVEQTTGALISPEQKDELSIAEVAEFRRLGWIGDQTLKLLGLFRDPIFGGLQEGAAEKAQQLQKEARQKKRTSLTGVDNTSFDSIEEAEAANLPSGTIVTIGGRRARIK